LIVLVTDRACSSRRARAATGREEQAIAPGPRPFRFTISMPPLHPSLARWRDEIRRIEDLGFSSVSISDHLTGGWAMDPVVAMTVAAEATSRLRVLSMVLCNDLRHPVLLHRAMANLDVFSGGRVEIGLGAGWKDADYRASGIAFDPAATRVGRLAESIDILTGLFAAGPLTYAGRYYRVSALPGLPRPVQRPHPPLLVGGGGRRILELAGRAADIVGVNPRLAPGPDPRSAVTELSSRGLSQKLAWARTAAVDSGRRPEELEFQQSMLDVSLTHHGLQHRWTSSLARGAGAGALAGSPAVLHGELSECVEALLARRETYGISYLHLGGNLAAASLIVGKLAGV
jgi:probable F420-dependent oxidoreductase